MDSMGEEEDIVVTGSRNLPGSVPGDITPEVTLTPADVRSYGVSSIADLLTELAPQTRSGRGGAPVILLGGRRIGSFAEIRDLPTEAILRVEVLPEEAALKLGYSADQRVVNVVLRRRFRSTTIEGSDRFATDGGRNNPRGQVGIVTISPRGRFNLNLDYQQSSSLLESERDVGGRLTSGGFDLVGNVVPANGAAEIDPALSALTGNRVTIAGVPGSAAAGGPLLADFAGTANRANISDQRRYRTLLPESRSFAANAVLARTVLGSVAATVNGRLEVSDSESLQGLAGVSLDVPAGSRFSPFTTPVTVNRLLDQFAPLRQSNRSITSHLGVSLNGDAGRWRWSVTGNYDRIDSKSFTDVGVNGSALQAAVTAGAVNPFGALPATLIGAGMANRATSTSSAGEVDGLLAGSLFSLPGGPVSTSLRLGLRTTDLDSRSVRAGLVGRGRVSRDIADGQINIDVPITSRSRAFLAGIGTLSVNFNAAARHLSDFGTLDTIGYGVNWSPLPAVRLIASVSDTEGAPSPQQLGDPVVLTPNARLFDYIRGTTVDVSRTSGGNPGLRAFDRHAFKAEANVRPFSARDLSLTLSYYNTRVRDAIASFPAASAAIEAAFPERFLRDGAGTLLRVDARPVNFERTDSEELRWGFNFSVPIKSSIQRQMEAFRAGTGPNPFEGLRRRDGGQGDTPRPPREGAEGETRVAPRAGEAGSGGGRAGGGGRFGGGGRGGFGSGGRGGGGGRLQFALYHSWHLREEVRIRPGLPVLDLLDGATVGGSGGGQPRHEIEAQAGYSNNGLGARLSANWQSATEVRGGTVASPQTLRFSDLSTVNLRLFADLGAQLQFARDHPWARGMRVTVSVDNLFNQRQRVTDQAGATPLGYQPDYLDPLGRAVRISVRKLFFSRSAR